MHTWMTSSQNDVVKMMLQKCSNIVANDNKLHVATNWLVVNNNFSFSDMTLFRVPQFRLKIQLKTLNILTIYW